MESNQILDIDVGNTALKWRLELDLSVQCSGRACHAEFIASLDKLFSEFGVPGRARLVSVAGDEFDSELLRLLHEAGVQQVDFAHVEVEAGGVVCGYEDVSQLGVDRWMAILAAAESSDQALAVVDFGSAITIDFVKANREHAGGFILPGWKLLYGALCEGTAINKQHIPDRYQAAAIFPGCSTVDAIGMGRLLACVAPVESALADFEKKEPLGVQVICTGGDAELFMPLLDVGAQCRPDLVLDGLRVALG